MKLIIDRPDSDSGKLTCPTCGGQASFAFSHSLWGVYRCSDRTCDLRFAHPQPTDEALAAAYAQDFRTTMYGSTPEAYASILVGALAERIGSLEDRRVLDFGAGIGTIAKALVNAGAQVDAIEQNPEGRDVIRASVDIPVAGNLAELAANGGRAPYDVIIMVEVIEHLRDPRATVAELAGLLREGGVLFVTTPNLVSLRARLEGSRWPNVASHTHLFYFTRRSLRHTLRLAGFDRVDLLANASRHPENSGGRRLLQIILRPLGLDGGIQVVASK